jgi:hypothetical protein
MKITLKKYYRSLVQENVSSVWSLVLERIQSYQEFELRIIQDISKIVEEDSINVEKIAEAVKKLESWKKSEYNPIEDVAKKV